MPHRKTSSLFLLITVWFIAAISIISPKTSYGEVLASLRLHNPTSCSAPALVEIPVGSLGNPECLDWNIVSLQWKGKKLPFTLREGAAHWRADLTAPIEKPSAEDLLVFAISITPGQWEQVDLVTGSPDRYRTLVHENGAIAITYPQLKVLVDEQTGQLTHVEAFGESILRDPLRYQFFDVDEETIEPIPYVGPGYHSPVAVLKKKEKQPPPKITLVASSATEVMTELHFTLEPLRGAAVGLTYRIYAIGQIDILSDERPWKGRSPWLDCCLEYDWAFAGTSETLPYLQSHFPYYGFKDYAAAVRQVGTLHRGKKTWAFELGEECANGRFWRRQLAIYPKKNYPEKEGQNKDALLQLLTQGLVVQTQPMLSQPLEAPLRLVCPEEMQTIGQKFVAGLQEAGIDVTLDVQPNEAAPPDITLRLLDSPATHGIRGDGFSVLPVAGGKQIEIVAGTKFGLFQGVSHVLRKMQVSDKSLTVPLIANNPVVDLRSGGFGGGNFEVDFPYGEEAEWKSVFQQLAASGMNTVACLGMWGNWKMPIRYKYMPELWSDHPEAYDELSGARFVDFDLYHDKSLRLIQALHDCGVKVWLWVPLGTIPTSFEEKYPEATLPTNRKVPRVIHPKYQEFLNTYFKEILELYPVDGFILIRDDNGGLDDTEEYKAYVNNSRTKNSAWEACLIAYDMLRGHNFKGTIAVYPYFDAFQPRLEPLLPEDLVIVGHGSGLSLLNRNYDLVLPMGDTWIDNPFTGGFRLPSSLQMKNLLSDRNSFWIGGAFCGTELPWLSMGYFGDQPTSSVNTFRYDIGTRMFGEKHALRFCTLMQSRDYLWEIMRNHLLPHHWSKQDEINRTKIFEEGRRKLKDFRLQFRDFQNEIRREPNHEDYEKWLAHVRLYYFFFEYNLWRAEVFGRMQDLIALLRKTDVNPLPLPDAVRKDYLAMYKEVDELARRYDSEMTKVPGDMMKHTHQGAMALPFKEQAMGYDPSLEFAIDVKQFAGRMEIQPSHLSPGKPFELSIELTNAGCMPWMPGAGPRIEFHGNTESFGLPKHWDYEGEPMIYGDKRVVTFNGTAPDGSGTESLRLELVAPFSNRVVMLEGNTDLTW